MYILTMEFYLSERFIISNNNWLERNRNLLSDLKTISNLFERI